MNRNETNQEKKHELDINEATQKIIEAKKQLVRHSKDIQVQVLYNPKTREYDKTTKQTSNIYFPNSPAYTIYTVQGWSIGGTVWEEMSEEHPETGETREGKIWNPHIDAWEPIEDVEQMWLEEEFYPFIKDILKAKQGTETKEAEER